MKESWVLCIDMWSKVGLEMSEELNLSQCYLLPFIKWKGFHN